MSAPLTWEELEKIARWSPTTTRLVAALEAGEALADAIENGDSQATLDMLAAAWRQSVAPRP